MKNSLGFYLCKIDRLMAWLLLVSMVLFFITGYGMTKGIINNELAVNMHNNLLPVLIMVALVFHAGYATRLALMRWKIWNIFGKIVWFSFFLLFIFGFIYLEFAYDPYASLEKGDATQLDQESKRPVEESTLKDETEAKKEESDVQVFDAQELAKYDGLDGAAPYVAVDGFVYDMTGIFKNGSHYGHKAGEELSNAFYMKHIKSSITKYPLVGEYSG